MFNDPHVDPELLPAPPISHLAKIIAGIAAGFTVGVTLLSMIKSCCHALAMLAGLFAT